MRPRRLRRWTAIAAYCCVAGATGCGGCWGRGDRDQITVDSAVLQALARKESASVYSVPPGATRDSAPPPPEILVSFPEPALVLSADSAAGQRIYRRAASCIACHGARAEGVAGMGSNVSDREWLRGNGSLTFLFTTIRDGVAETQGGGTRAVMPGVGNQLSNREIFQTAAYVYSLSHPGSVVADSSAAPPGSPPVAHAPPDTLRR